MDCSLPGSAVHGILQARILECIAIPFSRGFSQPRDWTWVSFTTGSLYHLSYQEAIVCFIYLYIYFFHDNKKCKWGMNKPLSVCKPIRCGCLKCCILVHLPLSWGYTRGIRDFCGKHTQIKTTLPTLCLYVCVHIDIQIYMGIYIYTYFVVVVLVAKACSTLCNLRTTARQAPLSMGFSRQEYWSGLPFPSPGDLLIHTYFNLN